MGIDRSKLELQKHYVALFRPQDHILETWSQRSGQEAISVALSQAQEGASRLRWDRR
jgi:hypothetical protein